MTLGYPLFLSEQRKRILWSGCWERRLDRTICRWILCWARCDLLIGTVGGYSGGGTFQLEKFFIRSDGGVVLEANERLSELISEIEIDLCEECLDKALSFHYLKSWIDFETLYLKNSARKSLKLAGDLLIGGSEIDFNFDSLFKSVGLITRPT